MLPRDNDIFKLFNFWFLYKENRVDYRCSLWLLHGWPKNKTDRLIIQLREHKHLDIYKDNTKVKVVRLIIIAGGY